MPAYLVRLIQNRDMVGFFAADEFEDLLMAVDECTNAGACEYMELPAGGIMWTSPAISVPVNLGDDEEADIENLPWANAELSDLWWSVVYGCTDEEWIRFDPDAPPPAAPKKPIGPATVIPLRKRPA
jgi:hypothetical protein